jgi:hypothetical protein
MKKATRSGRTIKANRPGWTKKSGKWEEVKVPHKKKEKKAPAAGGKK